MMIQTLHATMVGGTENAMAAVDVPTNGFMNAIQWSLTADLDADQDFVRVQLSFASTGAFTSNDARQIISTIQNAVNFTTSGLSAVGVNLFLPGLEIPVFGGERLYLHGLSNTGLIGEVFCHVYYSFDIGRTGMRRA